MATINELTEKFDKMNITQKKSFILNLKKQVEASNNPSHKKFLNECIQKYNAEYQAGSQQKSATTRSTASAVSDNLPPSPERDQQTSSSTKKISAGKIVLALIIPVVAVFVFAVIISAILSRGDAPDPSSRTPSSIAQTTTPSNTQANTQSNAETPTSLPRDTQSTTSPENTEIPGNNATSTESGQAVQTKLFTGDRGAFQFSYPGTWSITEEDSKLRDFSEGGVSGFMKSTFAILSGSSDAFYFKSSEYGIDSFIAKTAIMSASHGYEFIELCSSAVNDVNALAGYQRDISSVGNFTAGYQELRTDNGEIAYCFNLLEGTSNMSVLSVIIFNGPTSYAYSISAISDIRTIQSELDNILGVAVNSVSVNRGSEAPPSTSGQPPSASGSSGIDKAAADEIAYIIAQQIFKENMSASPEMISIYDSDEYLRYIVTIFANGGVPYNVMFRLSSSDLKEYYLFNIPVSGSKRDRDLFKTQWGIKPDDWID